MKTFGSVLFQVFNWQVYCFKPIICLNNFHLILVSHLCRFVGFLKLKGLQCFLLSIFQLSQHLISLYCLSLLQNF